MEDIVEEEKKLTPAIREAYEGHKKAGKISRTRIPDIQNKEEDNLHKSGKWKIKEENQKDNSYIKSITIDDEELLETFLEKIIKLGSAQGFVAFMSLYQYMYENSLLGKEVKEITGQEIIDHLYGENSYRLKPKNKQALLSSLLKLSGLQFAIKDKAGTQKIRKTKEKKNATRFQVFTLLKVKSFDTLENDEDSIISLNNVSIMPDFINIWYKKTSRLFIPLGDILLIPPDRNGNHRRGFNLNLALRHAELKRDYVEWDLRQCLNSGQWTTSETRKTEAWRQIISALEAGERKGLIKYELLYKKGKPQKLRYIQKVKAYRLWQKRKSASLGLSNFKPEEIAPKKEKTFTL